MYRVSSGQIGLHCETLTQKKKGGGGGIRGEGRGRRKRVKRKRKKVKRKRRRRGRKGPGFIPRTTKHKKPQVNNKNKNSIIICHLVPSNLCQ